MPVKLGLGAAGAVASAVGGSGKGGPTSRQVQSGTSTNSSSMTQNGTNATNYTEAPGILNFQQSLLPAVASLYAEAQKPVYGAAQTAEVANNADAATAGASSALAGRLARMGDLNSGANAAGQTSLAESNAGSMTNFFSQVPFLNQQAELQNTGNVLNIAEGIVGRAPVNSTTTSNNTATGVQTGVNNSTISGYGPGFGASLANSTGGALGNAAGKTGGGAGKGGGEGSAGGSTPMGG